ncbi:DMT family transporter [Silicimonas algicola]|uniref:Threonine/homoserine efflux transporter RhtA n=1 Tax=Silicimonas algicola TaxID=1826607 RepID=A0A316G2F9_9RHOB|nr:DMT family transporter [Silicimonas algicola]AZQ65772.1 DMT family transporter [Silicimonas algicola]PWK54852.1 threonine/homoserine efflux transporter RhtA [Silicimonas algicola]
MDFKAILAGLTFALIWSSAFTSARIIVQAAPPLTVSAIRFTLAGVIAVTLARALGQTWKLTPQQWRLTVLFGICQNALYLGLNFVAMQTVEASLAAIIASSLPLIVAALGWIVLGDRVRPLGLAGLIAGFAGVALIMGTRLTGGVDPVGVALCCFGALALATATLALKGASSGGNLVMVVGLQMLVGGAALWVPALLFETWTVTWSPLLVGAFLYTVIMPGLVATVLWFWLVGRIGAVRAATFHFLNPFFGVAIAAALLGEALRPLDVIGVAVIAFGILAVQLSRVPRT